MKKKITALVLAAVMAFGICGCGSSSADTSTQELSEFEKTLEDLAEALNATETPEAAKEAEQPESTAADTGKVEKEKKEEATPTPTPEPEETLLEAPASILKEYEEADYEKYASEEAEEEFYDTPLWIQGRVTDFHEKQSDGSTSYYFGVIETEDGKWNIEFDASVFLEMSGLVQASEYEALLGHEITACGLYDGYYDEKGTRPSILATVIFDRETGDTLYTVFGRVVSSSPEFDEELAKELMTRIEAASASEENENIVYLGNVSFSVPKDWGDYVTYDEAPDTCYYYPWNDMFMVSTSDYVFSSKDMTEQDGADLMESFAATMEEYEEIDSAMTELPYDGRQAFACQFKGTLSGIDNVSMMFAFIDDNYNPVAFVFFDTDETNEHFETFMDIIYTIKVGDGAVSSVISGGNADEKAQELLDIMAYSYSGLIEELETEGFSHLEAVAAADNCGADWNEEAVRMAGEYLDFLFTSETELQEQLEFEGFTEEQASYGVENCGADWNEQAAGSAKKFIVNNNYTHDELVQALMDEGFTKEQAEYGAKEAGV